MNDNFNFRRFGKYYESEIRFLISNKGISLLSIGLIPVIAFVVTFLFGSVFSDYEYMSISSRWVVAGFSAVIFAVWTPSNMYGYITELRAGSNYILVPASTLEKTLSMLLNMLIVIPLGTAALYLLSDIATTLVTGNSLDISLAANLFSSEIFSLRIFTEWVTTSGIFNTMNGLLLFLLGALWFRKHKIAMTLLSLLGLNILLSFIGLSGFRTFGLSSMEDIFEMRYEGLVIWSCIISILITIGLCTAVYFRLKKIQY